MSVILESRKGDELVCIGSFVATPEGTPFSWETCRTFHVGERVHYVDYYQDQNLKDNPVCWMVRFDAADGKRYVATQTYFVTLDCWEGLKRYFAKGLMREAYRRRAPKSKAQS